jgi:predicted regulator of Ras-like GTPase activity (Roadblock/LC7/MglB family)
METIISIAQKALLTTTSRRQAEQSPKRKRHYQRIDQLSDYLTRLKHETGVAHVILTSTAGNIIWEKDSGQSVDSLSLAALVAANFVAISEIVRLVGNRSEFKTSYQESDDYSIYARKVDELHLLVTVFQKRARLGVVAYYVKEIGEQIAEILAEEAENPTPVDEAFLNAKDDQLDDSFAQLFKF